MREARRHSRRAHEPLDHVALFPTKVELLQGDVAVEVLVVGQMDCRHPTTPYAAEDFVLPDSPRPVGHVTLPTHSKPNRDVRSSSGIRKGALIGSRSETRERPGRRVLCGQPGAPVGPHYRLLLRGLCGQAQARGAIRNGIRKRQPANASQPPSQPGQSSRRSYQDKSPFASPPLFAAQESYGMTSRCSWSRPSRTTS
jgi:hypothetical protein